MPSPRHPDLRPLFLAACDWVERNLGADIPILQVTLHLGHGLAPVTLPVPPRACLEGRPADGPDCVPARGPEADPSFVPTAFQEAILTALEGRALRTDALGHEVRDRSRLFRHPGGLKELREQGLVAHHPRLGYYRPDAPPEQFPV